MDERERRTKLEKLTNLEKIYIDVMYYRFLDKSVPEIKNILKISNQKTVYTRFTRIYEDLKITGDDKEAELIREYSPILLEFIKSDEDLNNWGHIRAEMLRQAAALPSQTESVQPSESPDVSKPELPKSEEEAIPDKAESTSTTPPAASPTDSQEKITKEQKKQITRRFPWFIVAITLLILCLLCISGVLFGLPRFASMFQTAIIPAQTTQTLTPQSPIATVTSQISNTATFIASQTSLPTSTNTALPTLTFTPTRTSLPTIAPTQPSPESTIISAGPSGDWAVRIYRTDDANIFLVNNHIVGGMTWGQKPLDWTGIDNLLQKDVPNYVTAVNVGYGVAAFWGFSLSHNDVIVWGNEGDTSCTGLCYTQTVQISPDDTIMEVNLRDFNKKPLSGPWSAKLLAADYGVIMVNGVAVAGSHKMADLGWYDLSGLLYEGQDNIITLAIWNDNGDYSWDAALRKGETVVWGSNNSGSGQVGEVFFTSVVVDGSGNVVP